MKLSQKQQRELQILKWWKPSNVKWGYITKKQIEDFFAWSDKGIKHGRNPMTDRDGFSALYWAKNRRDLQIQSYLEDWGSIMNAWSFTDMPLEVKEDIAKRMSKPAIVGQDVS
jgi:hypothetical protein